MGRAVEKQRMTQEDADAAFKRISYHKDVEDAAGVDWGVEAVIERIDLKKDICRKMLDTFAENAILATNTSSIAITDIATAAGHHADRVIGMHFFNPVPVMKLVEVIRGLATSDETTQRTIELAKRMGKTPVPANDRAGFVSNRVLMPMINEAFYAWMEGVAKPEDIDEIMKLGMAHPMGPLRLADFIGLDVCHNIMMVLHDKSWCRTSTSRARCCGSSCRPARLGDKTGRGVYDYGFGDVASEYAQNITEVNLIAAIADDVAIEYEEAGRELEWPPGSSWETAEYERDYPADLWADAKGRWEYMLPSEQDEYRTAHIEYVEGNVEQFRDTVVKEGFKESFGVLDIVFFGLAIASAFKLGASGGITEN
jgi:3-hydroxybutyryl-CoA dehydrogenase